MFVEKTVLSYIQTMNYIVCNTPSTTLRIIELLFSVELLFFVRLPACNRLHQSGLNKFCSKIDRPCAPTVYRRQRMD